MYNKNVFSFLFFGVFIAVSSALYEGDECVLRNGAIGECRAIKDCPAANLQVRNKFGSPSQFIKCGFKRTSIIICCADISPTTTTSSTSDPFDSSDISDGDIYFCDYENPRARPPYCGSSPKPVNTPAPTRRGKRKSILACERYTKERPPFLIPHILGGEAAAEGEFPHMAALGYQKDTGLSFDCGGTLISERFVLTAAHCVEKRDEIKPSVVRLGSVDLDQGYTDYNVAEHIVHPLYKRSLKYHDVAILRLEKDVTMNSFVYPSVCLETETKDPQSVVIVTGWGVIDLRTNAKSKELLKANLTSVNLAECNTTSIAMNKLRLPSGLNTGQMCAIDRANVGDTCTGDSGGPLQVPLDGDMYKLVAVTSFGPSTCGNGVPGVYARISYYLDWIEGIVWP